MKDLFKWALAFVIMVILSALATLAVLKYAGDKVLPRTFDSSAVLAASETNSYPYELKSLAEVFMLQQEMKSCISVDSTFLSMNDDVMSNVVGVLLKRTGTTCKEDIVNEYLTGRAIYENLPQGPTVQSDVTTTTDPIASISLEKVNTTTVTEAPTTGVVTTKSPPSTKDTVINGKKYKQVE